MKNQPSIAIVTALWIGKNTQNIGRRLGFNVIHKELSSIFFSNRKTFSKRIGDNNANYQVAVKVFS
jgi:hypothetical protein